MSGANPAQKRQVRTEWESLKRVWELMGSERRGMLWSMVFRLAQSFVLGGAFGGALWVIREISTGRELTQTWVWQVTLLMAISLLGQMIFSFLSVNLAWQISYRVCGGLRLSLLGRLQELPLGFHLNHHKGDLASTLTSDINMLEIFLSDGLSKIVQAFGLPLAVFVFMLFQDWRLALVMIFSILLALPLMVRTSRRLGEVGLIRQDMQATAASRMVEFILGMKVIRAFGRLSEGHTRFNTALAEYRDISIDMVDEFVRPVMSFIAIVMSGLALTFIATGLLFGGISTGTTIAALVLAFSMYSPVVALVSATVLIRGADASLARIDRVLSAKLLPETNAPKAPDGFEIEFEALSFNYGGGADVLEEVSFKVPERSMTAVVGPSGAGKSTILNLIARFWDPTKGGIRIGGVPIADLSPEKRVELVSFVFQDVYLFSGTIADNIAMGRAGASDSEIVEAAKAAQAHAFITSMPNGYETEVGEGGARLSGGERQRIAVARAILKDAPIVLLDEATAAIDPIHERALQQALANLVADRTLVIVAHKLSTIESADQIIVLEEGKIAETGTHQKLIAQKGLYARLFSHKAEAEGWTISTKTTGDV